MTLNLPSVSQTPIAVAYTPNSILRKKVPFRTPSMPKKKRRYSTCTDVAWINNNSNLAVINYAAEIIHVYAFDRQNLSFTLNQTLSNQNGMQLHEPDKFAFSPNGLYLAVANNKYRKASVNMYQVDPKTQLINPVPFQVIKHKSSRFHGVRFSPNSQYMVSTITDGSGRILIHKLNPNPNGTATPVLTQAVKNRYLPLKPKSVNFSSDGSLMIVCYSSTPGRPNSPRHGAVAIYSFNNITGTINTRPLCVLKGRREIAFTDDVSFSHDALSSFIVLTSQLNNSVVFYRFNRNLNKISPKFSRFRNPRARLNFPHGLALSTDNKYLAVSNYGDDKVNVYLLKN